MNKLNIGFLSVSNLAPWLIFRAWIVTDQLDKDEKIEREDGKRGEAKGDDYSREAIR